MKHKIEWEFSVLETLETATDNKAWLKRKGASDDDLKSFGLFKPDSERNESQTEYEVSFIGNALEIPCAKISVINSADVDWTGSEWEETGYDEVTGTLSHNFKTDKNILYPMAEKVINADGEISFVITNNNAYISPNLGSMDIKSIINEFPELKSDVIKMAYLDCLVNNNDRNSRNWHLMVDGDKKILGVAKLFDHAIALNNSYQDISIICYEKTTGKYAEPHSTHTAVFTELCEYHLHEIAPLMLKTEKLLKSKPAELAGVQELLESRFDKMQEIYKAKQPETQCAEQAKLENKTYSVAQGF